MVGDEGAESLLAQIDELIQLVERSGSRNGGKARRATLKKVRQLVESFHRTGTYSDLYTALELVSEFVMGER